MEPIGKTTRDLELKFRSTRDDLADRQALEPWAVRHDAEIWGARWRPEPPAQHDK